MCLTFCGLCLWWNCLYYCCVRVLMIYRSFVVILRVLCLYVCVLMIYGSVSVILRFFLVCRASDKCQKEKRKTISGDDLLWAMATLGFEDYIDPLKAYLARYREVFFLLFNSFYEFSLFAFWKYEYLCFYLYFILLVRNWICFKNYFVLFTKMSKCYKFFHVRGFFVNLCSDVYFFHILL